MLAVTGGPGAYGGYVIELAKAAGLIVIADAAETDRALLETLGADVVVARGDGFAERIREHFPEGVDGLADGALLLNDLAIPAVKDGGGFTAVRGFRGEAQRDIKFTETWVMKYNERYELLDTLRQQVRTGRINSSGGRYRLPRAGKRSASALGCRWHARPNGHRLRLKCIDFDTSPVQQSG